MKEVLECRVHIPAKSSGFTLRNQSTPATLPSIATAALKVSGAGEPPDDVPKVQQTMESEKVLDVARYPRITFESSSVAPGRRDAATLDIVVAGQLTIRDVTQPVTVPVHVTLTDRAVAATGRFSVKQTAFGIKPISIGGVVSVKDTLDITFSIAARRP